MADGLSGEEQAIYFSKIRGFFDSYACSRVMERRKKMSEHLPDTNVGNIEYIRKQDALDAFGLSEKTRKYGGDHSGYDTMMLYEIHDVLTGLPSADVAPVVHGKWIDEDPAFAEYFANCSVCGYEIDVHNERGYFNFCPNCGAKMDGERKG